MLRENEGRDAVRTQTGSNARQRDDSSSQISLTPPANLKVSRLAEHLTRITHRT